MKIELSQWPPSVNQLYVNAGRYRNLSPKARIWIAKAKEEMKNLSEPESLIGQRLKVTATFYGPLWMCKNGNIRKADVSSREKCLIDTIFSLWPNMDDSAIWDLRLIKEVAEYEKVTIEFQVYN